MQRSTTLHEAVMDRAHAYSKFLWIAAFAVLTAIGAQVEIFHQPVPFTLQTFFVLLAGGLLGRRNGAISMSSYLFLGVCGLPVFAGASLGIMTMLGPTGGYLLAFPLAAALIGLLIEKRKTFLWILFSMSIGLLFIFALGTVQLQIVYMHNWMRSVQSGFLIFSLWDLIKLLGAASITHQYFRRVH